LILHKSSGDTYEVTGLVGSSGIQSEDISVPIEKDDFFERKLPNGITEYYQVTDPGFHKGMHEIPDHYQTKVKQIYSPITYDEEENELQKMIFISHSLLTSEQINSRP